VATRPARSGGGREFFSVSGSCSACRRWVGVVVLGVERQELFQRVAGFSGYLALQ
jgi:hypothetical protein